MISTISLPTAVTLAFSFMNPSYSYSPKVTISLGFSGTVPIFNDMPQKKSQFSRDAHLSYFCLGITDLSWHWQTALFHRTNTNTYLLELNLKGFYLYNVYMKKLLAAGALPRIPLGELTMLPQTPSWTPDGLQMWHVHPTTHAFGTHPGLQCPNYGHLILTLQFTLYSPQLQIWHHNKNTPSNA